VGVSGNLGGGDCSRIRTFSMGGGNEFDALGVIGWILLEDFRGGVFFFGVGVKGDDSCYFRRDLRKGEE